jgi:AcrR family transcriptional regulator
MSREPTLGPLGRSATAATGIEHGSSPLPARRGSAQQGAAERAPSVNKPTTRTIQNGARTGQPDLRTGTAVSQRPATAQPAPVGQPDDAAPLLRPSRDGGLPALQRELGAHGRETVRRLLEAGLAEFEEAGFQGARVEDIVRRAKTSHGTFYLYFANKDDLFRTLLRDALVDMANITDEFPVVTANDAGRAALRRWVQSFCDTYAAHATVIRILSQAEIVGESVFSDGLQLFFRLSEVMTQGMTVAQGIASDEHMLTEHAELTAVACLMMLERINYLMSAEVRLPKEEMIDRLTAIIYAAFRS